MNFFSLFFFSTNGCAAVMRRICHLYGGDRRYAAHLYDLAKKGVRICVKCVSVCYQLLRGLICYVQSLFVVLTL